MYINATFVIYLCYFNRGKVIPLNRARELREKYKLTQQEVADATEIDKLTLLRYESEKCSMRIDNIWKIADFYDVSIDYLIGRSDDPKSFQPGEHSRIVQSYKDFGSFSHSAEFPKDAEQLARMIERIVQIALDERDAKG